MNLVNVAEIIGAMQQNFTPYCKAAICEMRDSSAISNRR